PLVGGLAEEVFESASGAIIPGPRVDPGGFDPDPIPDLAMSGRVDLGDPIQEGAVEGRQLFGGRLLIHRPETMGRSPCIRNSPPVLPDRLRTARTGWSHAQSPTCAPLRTPNEPNEP